MWLSRFTIAHRVDRHGLSRIIDSLRFAKTLPDPFFGLFLQSLLRPPFPGFLDFCRALHCWEGSESGNRDLLVASWIFSSKVKVDFAIVLLVPPPTHALACWPLALNLRHSIPYSRMKYSTFSSYPSCGSALQR